MNDWSPPEHLQRAVIQIITRAGDAANLVAKRRVRERATQGLTSSGVQKASREAAAEAIRSCGQRATSEVLELFQSVYTPIPKEALRWIYDTITQRINSFARSHLHTLKKHEERSDPESASKSDIVINGAVQDTLRDLDIALAPFRVRAEHSAAKFPKVANYPTEPDFEAEFGNQNRTMGWKPDEQLERLVTLAIAERREAMSVRQQRDGGALDTDLTHRGLLNSGAHLTGHYRIISEAFDEAAQGVIDDVIALFREVYGSVPLEAAPWIRTRIEQWLDGMATSIARTGEEMRRNHNVSGSFDPPAGYTRAKRRLERELGTLEVRARLKQLTPPERRTIRRPNADCFICHASEDKDVAARPIADALRGQGYLVWLDETELKIGDRLLDKIDEGLASCRFGVVVVSSHFFRKNWTRRELAGLVAREDAEERTIILPVWLDVDHPAIAQHLPSLAGILAANMADGIERVVGEIVRAMGPPSSAR